MNEKSVFFSTSLYILFWNGKIGFRKNADEKSADENAVVKLDALETCSPHRAKTAASICGFFSTQNCMKTATRPVSRLTKFA